MDEGKIHLPLFTKDEPNSAVILPVGAVSYQTNTPAVLNTAKMQPDFVENLKNGAANFG